MRASSLDFCPRINTDLIHRAFGLELAVQHKGSDQSLPITPSRCSLEFNRSECLVLALLSNA